MNTFTQAEPQKSNTCKTFRPCSHISGSNDSSGTEWCWAKKLQFKDTFSGHSDSCGVPITLQHYILTLMHYILVPEVAVAFGSMDAPRHLKTVK
jgi:hypothetical protein